MRERMANDMTAQLVLGGRISGQTGFAPGIAEEVACGLAADLPIYPLGAFGGCGAVVVDAMRGAHPDELTLDYQYEHGDVGFRAMIDLDRDEADTAIARIAANLRDAGFPALNNGLSTDDNEQLVQTDDIEQIVILVLRGLQQIEQRDPKEPT
jgi:hypothetical protein